MSKRPAVFLDRDGTLMKDAVYADHPDDVAIYRRAPAALRLLQKAGFALVVITNQSGLGRGYFTWTQLRRVHDRLSQLLRRRGVRISGYFVCPHQPSDHCGCRKPKIQLVRRAVRDLKLDLKGSFMVGDRVLDMAMARRLKIPAVRVRTGHGWSEKPGAPCDYAGRDLMDAAHWILTRGKVRR